MTIYLRNTLADGSTIVIDTNDGASFVLKPGQWSDVQARPREEQRAAVEAFVLANRTSGDPRTQAEQEQIDAASQGQGDRHQDAEDAR